MRVLIVSDSPGLASGQARVVRELADRFLDNDDEVAVAGWFHDIIPPQQYRYTVTNIRKDIPSTAEFAINAYKPDVVLAIGDPHDFAWLSSYRAERGRFILVGYLNIEAAPITPDIEVVLDGFDVLTTTSEFGAKTLEPRQVTPIHHGVDLTVFTRKNKPKKAFGRDLEDTFVVLVNAQNIQRKNLPTALEGFKKFVTNHGVGIDKPDSIMYMNTRLTPAPGDAVGWDLRPIVHRLGLSDRVFANNENFGPYKTVDDEEVNEMYAAADVLLVTSFAEGFCLPVLEAMATWTMPIAPDGYSMKELIGQKRGLLIPVSATYLSNRATEYQVVSSNHVAAALELAYEMWRDSWPLDKMRAEAAMYAMSHTWDSTFSRLYDCIMSERMPRVASGKPIDTVLRRRARSARARNSNTLGVLKLGGLGDMLQTTAVIAAAYRKYDRKAIVFTNSSPDIFNAMREVEDVIDITVNRDQDYFLRSVCDEFDLFLDVRYVSWIYGDQPSEFAIKYRSFYDGWGFSTNRLVDLGKHATEIMLESLGLTGSIIPRYSPRDGGPAVEGKYIALATGVGAAGKLKQWPMYMWEVTAEKLDEYGFSVVQVGGEKDPPVPGVADFRGASLPRTASIIEHACALAGVEGGMVHLAAAVGTPAAVIFGPTPPTVLAYKQNIALSQGKCTPCWWNYPTWATQTCPRNEPICLNFVDSDSVVSAVKFLSVLKNRRNVDA